MAVGDLTQIITEQHQQFLNPGGNNTPPPVNNEPPVPPVNNAPPPENTPLPPDPLKGELNAAPPTPPAWNEAEYLKANFGYEKLDEVKNTWSGLAQLQEQNKKLSDEVQQYKPIVETFNKSGEVGKLFVNSIANGIDPRTLSQIYDLKPETLTAEQAWKINEKLTNSYLSDAQINALYHSKFHVDENELDQNVIELKGAELAKAAQNARTGIKDYMGKTLNPVNNAPDPAVEKAAAEARLAELQTKWQPATPALANALKTLSGTKAIQKFGAKAGETDTVEFKYNVTDEQHKAIMEQALRTVYANGIVPDEKNMKDVTQYAQRLMWADYGEQIANARVDDAVTHLMSAFEAIMSNPNLAATMHVNNNSNPAGLNVHEQGVLAKMSRR